MAVFESVSKQSLFRNPAIEKVFDLLYHAFFETLAQTHTNTLHHYLARETDTDNDMLHVGHVGILIGVLDVIFLDF